MREKNLGRFKGGQRQQQQQRQRQRQRQRQQQQQRLCINYGDSSETGYCH